MSYSTYNHKDVNVAIKQMWTWNSESENQHLYLNGSIFYYRLQISTHLELEQNCTPSNSMDRNKMLHGWL